MGSKSDFGSSSERDLSGSRSLEGPSNVLTHGSLSLHGLARDSKCKHRGEGRENGRPRKGGKKKLP